jgi:hypothetical protein
MAYTRQITISVLVAPEAPINEHLIKLLVLTDDKASRRHWVNELAALYERIEDIRPVPQHRVFWDCLFANRFTPDGERPIARILTRLARQHEREIALDPATVLAHLRQFHEQCCALLANGQSPQSLILALEPKPFEMPAVTTSALVADCGLGDKTRDGLIPHRPHEVVTPTLLPRQKRQPRK